MKLAILGAGAFGTALANVYAEGGTDVVLWSRSSHQVKALNKTRESVYLPGVTLHDRVTPTSAIEDIHSTACVLLAVPAQQTAAFLERHASDLPDVPLVLCAKGIDRNSGALQTEIVQRFRPQATLAALTGPGFASEIAIGKPTALTLACNDPVVGRNLQHLLSTDRLRLYLTDDMIGAQLGGALKNVIAIAAGLVAGAGLGESARAALLTRGFAEMRRLGTAMGGQDETFAGLSGLGDLVLTASSKLSRNYSEGFALGQGQKHADGTTVEGIATAVAACQLAQKYSVDMPITFVVADVLNGSKTLDQAMQALLSRPLKQE